MSNSHHHSALLSFAEKCLFLSLALVFIWFGAMKFSAYEAAAIQGFLVNSPFLSIINDAVGNPVTMSMMIGSVEILIGVLLLLGLFSAKLGMIGGLLATLTFIATITFFFTTPGVFAPGGYPSAEAMSVPELAFPALSVLPGQFLLKDFVLLAASFWAFACAKEACA